MSQTDARLWLRRPENGGTCRVGRVNCPHCQPASEYEHTLKIWDRPVERAPAVPRIQRPYDYYWSVFSYRPQDRQHV